MTRHLLTLFVFVSLKTLTVLGQDSTSATKVYRSNITIEVGGAGIIGSINYEHLISYSHNTKLLFRAGLMDYNLFGDYQDTSGSAPIFILGMYYLTGKKKNHLELGFNNTLLYEAEDKDFIYFLVPSIGYRYQNYFSKSFTFSAAFSPLFPYYSEENPGDNWQFLPGAKIGLGYSFNGKNINTKTQTKSNQSDTISFPKRFFIEFGLHCLTAIQHSISKNRNKNDDSYSGGYDEIQFPIDTTNLYVNSLVVNRRFFPSISAGIYFRNHEFNAEFGYANYESKFSYHEDFGKDASFKSKEYYVLAGYSYTGLKNRKSKLNPNTRLFIGINLSFQQKIREFYYDLGYILHSRSDILNSDFNSNHISLLPDAGIKLGCNNKVYFKFGFRFNAFSYVYGSYSWKYITTYSLQPTETSTEDSGNFSQLLFGGESSYYPLLDNVYFKVGIPL